jgi:hypothetical protein
MLTEALHRAHLPHKSSSTLWGSETHSLSPSSEQHPPLHRDLVDVESTVVISWEAKVAGVSALRSMIGGHGKCGGISHWFGQRVGLLCLNSFCTCT